VSPRSLRNAWNAESVNCQVTWQIREALAFAMGMA
jgi:hypothetical protein